MNLQTLMQAAPAKANELFVRLAETSDGAVKTREKLFTELKTELELHTALEEQHLFPILRRNAETKELVADAIKDNKELRTKLAEIEVLPKNDDAFPDRLKELQKTFRQHARDDKRELLPAVQRALSEAQVQGIAQKMEAGIAQAEQAKHDELEERRMKARQERERAEQQAERQEEAERAKKAAADRVRHEEAEQRRAKATREHQQAELRAEQEAASEHAQQEVKRQVRDAAEVVTRTAMASQTNVLRIAEDATAGAQRINGELRNAAETYTDAMKAIVPDVSAVASLPGVAVGAMNEIRSASMDWLRQTTQAGTQISQELLRQASQQQRQFASLTAQRWMEYNSRIMQITMQMAQESVRRISTRAMVGSNASRRDR
jgi:hemerythrin HHE cation binding domain-containing protein